MKSFDLPIFHFSFFIVFSCWDVVWNAAWRALPNQFSEEEQKDFDKVHIQMISDVLGEDGV